MLQIIQAFQQKIGLPAEVEQDPRAGITAVWGSRQEGGFAIGQDPLDSKREVNLFPAANSNRKVQILRLTEAELVQWLEENIEQVRQVLQGF